MASGNQNRVNDNASTQRAGQGTPTCQPRNENFRRQKCSQNSMNNYDTEQNEWNSHSESQLRTNQYAVNLQLAPVEKGIKAKNDAWEQEFKGIGAFNHYFGLLAPPSIQGYTLPDNWDGYYHITLAKLSSDLAPHQLEEALSKFKPSLGEVPFIPDIVFRASRIEERSGAHRLEGRQEINFIVLLIDKSSDIEKLYDRVQPLLAEIKDHTRATKWDVTELNKLHVTIRKYSNIDFDLGHIEIGKFPLEFRCTHLEVKQTRRQAVTRFQNSENMKYKWWKGVTKINDKCSGCNTPMKSDHWKGFCLVCGKYESLIPIWSTDGQHISHIYQIQEQNGK